MPQKQTRKARNTHQKTTRLQRGPQVPASTGRLQAVSTLVQAANLVMNLLTLFSDWRGGSS